MWGDAEVWRAQAGDDAFEGDEFCGGGGEGGGRGEEEGQGEAAAGEGEWGEGGREAAEELEAQGGGGDEVVGGAGEGEELGGGGSVGGLRGMEVREVVDVRGEGEGADLFFTGVGGHGGYKVFDSVFDGLEVGAVSNDGGVEG